MQRSIPDFSWCLVDTNGPELPFTKLIVCCRCEILHLANGSLLSLWTILSWLVIVSFSKISTINYIPNVT